METAIRNVPIKDHHHVLHPSHNANRSSQIMPPPPATGLAYHPQHGNPIGFDPSLSRPTSSIAHDPVLRFMTSPKCTLFEDISFEVSLENIDGLLKITSGDAAMTAEPQGARTAEVLLMMSDLGLRYDSFHALKSDFEVYLSKFMEKNDQAGTKSRIEAYIVSKDCPLFSGNQNVRSPSPDFYAALLDLRPPKTPAGVFISAMEEMGASNNIRFASYADILPALRNFFGDQDARLLLEDQSPMEDSLSPLDELSRYLCSPKCNPVSDIFEITQRTLHR